MRHLAAAVAAAASLTACGGESNGTGDFVNDSVIEAQIANEMADELGQEYRVDCPDGGIETETDFSCIATAAGLGARARIDNHLDSDRGIQPFDPGQVTSESGPAAAFR